MCVCQFVLCVRVFVCVRVRACVRACVRVCVCVCLVWFGLVFCLFVRGFLLLLLLLFFREWGVGVNN